MPTAARYILLGVLLIGGYYALIFGYAGRVRRERQDHVAWRFPLRGGSDYCADPLADGGCVCSDSGTVYIVKDGKQTGKFVAYESDSKEREYPPYEGYQWIGGTRDNLALIAAAKPPMDQLALYAVESDGKVRWQAELPPGQPVSWIACSPDAIFVLTYDLDDPKLRQGNNVKSTVHRFDLQGKLVYTITPDIGVLAMEVSKDNWVYLSDNMQATIQAYGPDGKLKWHTPVGGTLPPFSNYLDDGTLYYQDSTRRICGFGRDGKQRFTFSTPASGTIPQGGAIWEELRSAMSSQSYAPWSNYNSSDLADGGGQLYAIDDDERSLVAASSNGKQLWQQALPSKGLCVVADSKGRVYVTLRSGGLICYSAAGKELWRNTSLHTFSSAMSVGEDDRVLVEADGELICLRP